MIQERILIQGFTTGLVDADTPWWVNFGPPSLLIRFAHVCPAERDPPAAAGHAGSLNADTRCFTALAVNHRYTVGSVLTSYGQWRHFWRL